MQDQPPVPYTPVSEVSVEARASFISKTYGHVTGAILLFTLIEIWLFKTGRVVPLSHWLLSFNWLLVIGGLTVAAWLATHVAQTTQSKPYQYLALFGFVLAYAIVFAPLLLIASSMRPGIIEDAAQITLLGTIGLSAVAFYTRRTSASCAAYWCGPAYSRWSPSSARCCSECSSAPGSRSR